jgi:hypothetical protein
MIRWTLSAKVELERYCARLRPALETSGADAVEVADDLKRHIDEEIAAARLQAVTEQDVRRILARMGEPDIHAVEPPSRNGPEPCREPEPAVSRKPSLRLALLVFGVALPLITLGIELATGMCAGAFFDPIPTWWHVALVAFVPLANLLLWLAARQGKTTGPDLSRLAPTNHVLFPFDAGGGARSGFSGWAEHRNPLAWANAFAIGITLFYAILFLPLLPAASIALLFFGWGLLPMSPLLAFIAALRLRHHLRHLGPTSAGAGLPGLWRGMPLAFAAVLALQLPITVTQIGLQMATSDSATTRARGVQWLRSLGDEQTLLRACYGRTRWATHPDLFTWLFSDARPVSAGDARTVYYRVTGRAFNSVPPPKVFTARGRWEVLEQEFTFDNDQGGDAVAGRVKGLSLASSRQDGLIDADAALAYLEWTFEFKNVSTQQREARAQILLPPGGVVSRLTLWINGEECEAAFGGRSQVRAAYQQVVQQRRDPVLVTTCGPDRVLMQCFPVPAGGESMKVRIGVTAPLVLTKAEEAAFRWPCFLERNFTIPEDFNHTLWIESRQPLQTAGSPLKSERTHAGLVALRGTASENALCDPQNVVRVLRDSGMRQAWTADTRDTARRIIRQIVTETRSAPPQRIVFVVDGSQAMAPYLPAVGEALTNLPAGMEFALMVANDQVRDLPRHVEPGSRETYRRAADELGRLRAVGGQDNVPALLRAWDIAAESPAGAVVWIHGPQPVLLDRGEELRQRFERRPISPVLYEIQTHAGPNRVAEKLDGILAVKFVPRLGPLNDDLRRLLGTWNADAKSFAIVRERLNAEEPAGSMTGKQTSLHLARLWAFEEILRLISARKIDQALELAGLYQLVTPVSGAVVLETKAQYQAAGLKPVDAESVPAVPEPSTWVLLSLGALLLAGRALRRRPGR